MFLKWLERQRDKFRTGPLRSMINQGNWRVEYPDGGNTFWMDYRSACNIACAFGGKVIHKNQRQ